MVISYNRGTYAIDLIDHVLVDRYHALVGRKLGNHHPLPKDTVSTEGVIQFVHMHNEQNVNKLMQYINLLAAKSDIAKSLYEAEYTVKLKQYEIDAHIYGQMNTVMNDLRYILESPVFNTTDAHTALLNASTITLTDEYKNSIVHLSAVYGRLVPQVTQILERLTASMEIDVDDKHIAVLEAAGIYI